MAPHADESMLRQRLPPVYHQALDGYLRSGQHPEAIVATILAEGPDTGTNGAPGKTWGVIGRALLDMQAAGKPFQPTIMRAFVKRLLTESRDIDDDTESPGERARRVAAELEREAS